MARRPRYFAPGSCHHVTQRGNNRGAIFGAAQDYELFLLALGDALGRFDVALHGYVLMTNHVHLVMTPADPAGICLTMQAVGRRYVYYYNREYGRTGALFEGRYKAFAIDSEDYWYKCMRYVEENPVRAGMVLSSDAYRWSSRRAHALGAGNGLLSAHPLYLALGPDADTRQQAWRAICGPALTTEELDTIRHPASRHPTLSRSVAGSDPGDNP